jgi:hypothetical protein
MHLFSCSCSGLPHLEVATCVYFAACLPCLYDASRCCCLLYSASSKKKQEARLPRAAAGAGGCTAAPAGLALLSAALALPYLLFTYMYSCTRVIHMYRYSCTARPLLLRAHACCCVHGCRSVGGPIHVTVWHVCSAASSSEALLAAASSSQQPAAASQQLGGRRSA